MKKATFLIIALIGISYSAHSHDQVMNGWSQLYFTHSIYPDSDESFKFFPHDTGGAVAMTFDSNTKEIKIHKKLSLNDEGIIEKVKLLHGKDGSDLFPTYAFASDPDTGMYRDSENTLAFSTAGEHRMRIEDTAWPDYKTRVGIGTTDPAYTLDVVGTFNSSGSSKRYKRAIRPYHPTLSQVLTLTPISFKYKKKYQHFGKKLGQARQIGLIAEEVAKIMPELAVYGEDKIPINVDYEKLTVVLLNALKTMKVDTETEIRTLNARLQAIQDTLK